jgi:hypothetical protein
MGGMSVRARGLGSRLIQRRLRPVHQRLSRSIVQGTYDHGGSLVHAVLDSVVSE